MKQPETPEEIEKYKKWAEEQKPTATESERLKVLVEFKKQVRGKTIEELYKELQARIEKGGDA